jgi:GWxTD domain-containing protein
VIQRAIALSIVPVLAGGCGSWQRVGQPEKTPAPGTAVTRMFDAASAYKSMGSLVGGGALPFVASVRYLAGPGADSTLALFSLSLSNQTLSFAHRGSEFVAEYHVEATFRTDSAGGGSIPVRQIASDEQIRVRHFRETLRTDESVIYQKFVMLPPGTYAVSVIVRDRNSPAFSHAERTDTAPRFSGQKLSRPVAVYTAIGRRHRSELPKLVMNPRATLPYGTDSMRFYVERYEVGPGPVIARVVDGTDKELWRDSAQLTGDTNVASATLIVAPGNLPVGQAELEVMPAEGGDTVRARFLVSFSNQWVITNFEEMSNLLRYFDRQDWVDSLKRTAPEHRPEVWRDFWRATDPNPITAENEALDDYFRRVQEANVRFQDEGQPGWMTERGEVLITLGEADEMLDMTNSMDRSGLRVLRWTYSTERLVLFFEDQTGFNRFRLTPSSRAEYQRVLARVRRTGR